LDSSTFCYYIKPYLGWHVCWNVDCLTCLIYKLIEWFNISDDSNNDIIDDIINYWHEYFELTKVHENVLDWNGGLSDQHLAIQYKYYMLKNYNQWDTNNAIIGVINTNCFHRIFVNDNHWILINIHAFILVSHHTTYDSNTLASSNQKTMRPHYTITN